MQERIIQLTTRLKEIQDQLADPAILSQSRKVKSLNREQSDIEEILSLSSRIDATKKEIADCEEIIRDGSDAELAAMAQQEIEEKTSNLEKLTADLRRALLPKDENDKKDVIVEIRAGAGGDEAALFAGNLFRMYSRFAEAKGWKVEVVSSNTTGQGGYKEVIFEVHGERVYGTLKYESGVHRVQRIPETEKSGRIHTSTATVVILPEVEEKEIEIRPEDIRIDVYRSGGHGGQSVNTTDSAVRITHFPSGIVVTCQNERSQLKNKEQAMKVLRTRLFEAEEERKQKESGNARKIQIGTGDRSEKIRTYNVPQDRITDHRIKFTTHGVTRVLEGDLDELTSALKTADENAQIASAG